MWFRGIWQQRTFQTLISLSGRAGNCESAIFYYGHSPPLSSTFLMSSGRRSAARTSTPPFRTSKRESGDSEWSVNSFRSRKGADWNMWKGFSKVLRNCRVALVVLVFFLPSLNAQQRPEVFKILGITVEGQTSADPQAIIANTGLKVGAEISVPGSETATAIHRLFQLKLFSDVQILIENRVESGVYLLIRVKENPRLESIEITGNDELSTEDIQKKINLTKGQIVSHQELSTIKHLLKMEYEKEGYLNARIDTKLTASEDTSSRRVNLVVAIDEGSVVKVGSINFFGNSHFAGGGFPGAFRGNNDPP